MLSPMKTAILADVRPAIGQYSKLLALAFHDPKPSPTTR
jgi:hypothetical protein